MRYESLSVNQLTCPMSACRQAGQRCALSCSEDRWSTDGCHSTLVQPSTQSYDFRAQRDELAGVIAMRIGILTGGGDVPGLNPCIKAVVTRAEENGWEVVGIRRGWAGLLNVNLDDTDAATDEWIEPLTRRSVRTIDRYGGTHLHTSRTNPQNVRTK